MDRTCQFFYGGYLKITRTLPLIIVFCLGSVEGLDGCIRKLKINSHNFLFTREDRLFITSNKLRKDKNTKLANIFLLYYFVNFTVVAYHVEEKGS